MEGPPRWMLPTTHGVSVIIPKPMFSIMRLNPGPEVAVMDFTPAFDAPRIAAMDAISSSIWIYTPLICGRRQDICSATSVAGVNGYPAKNLQPALSAPSAHAISPFIKCSPVKTGLLGIFCNLLILSGGGLSFF